MTAQRTRLVEMLERLDEWLTVMDIARRSDRTWLTAVAIDLDALTVAGISKNQFVLSAPRAFFIAEDAEWTRLVRIIPVADRVIPPRIDPGMYRPHPNVITERVRRVARCRSKYHKPPPVVVVVRAPPGSSVAKSEHGGTARPEWWD